MQRQDLPLMRSFHLCAEAVVRKLRVKKCSLGWDSYSQGALLETLQLFYPKENKTIIQYSNLPCGMHCPWKLGLL